MLLKFEFLLAVFGLILTFSNAVRTKRMYALCPPKFIRIGNECYYISKEKVSWLDAHFECKDRNSRLAEPIKFEDKALRKYFIKSDTDHSEKWLGCIYNWEQNKWQWGYNGRDLTYQSFSQMIPGSRQDLKFHCAVLNPNLKYRWSARSCVDKHTFVCQHRMPYVNANNRQKIYDRWNATYPNQIANEIEVLVAEGGNFKKNQTRRLRMDKIHPTRYHGRNNIHNNNVLDDSGVQESRLNNRINKRRKHQHMRTQDQPQNDSQFNGGYPVIVETISDYSFNEIRNNTVPKPKQRLRRPRKHRRKPTTTTVAPTTELPSRDLNESFDQINRIDELQRAHIIEKERSEQENLRLMEERQRDDELRVAQQKRFLEEQRRQESEVERKRLEIEEIQRAEQNDERMKYEKQKKHKEEQERREEQMRKDEEQLKNEEEQLRKNEEDKLKEINKRIEEERKFREKEHKKLEEEKRREKYNDEIKSITEIPTVIEHVSIIDKVAEEKRLRREKLKARLRNLSPEKQAEFFNRRKDRMNNKNGERKNNESIIPE